MGQAETIAALNRLLRVLSRSLPVYLEGTAPWVRPGNERLRDALRHVARDEQMYAGRVAEAIYACGGRPDPGPVPVRFTDTHDLGVDFLCRLVLEHQRADVEAIRRSVEALAGDPPLYPLAREILGNAVGHLETLEEETRGEG